MKKNLIKLASLVTILAFGLGIAINTQKQPIEMDATQHSANYADFTYSGSYYNTLITTGTDGLKGTFQSALSSLIFPKGWYIYSGGSGNSNYLSGALQEADEDPTNSNNMVYLYTRDSVAKNPAQSWNREHVWPQSLSGTNPTTHDDNWGTTEAGTDILHLRPTYVDTNSRRGNKIYGYISGTKTAEKYNGMTYGYVSGNYFEPIDSVKGDVARIIMYVYVAYNAHYENSLNILNTFASYDTLIKWHTLDKPDALEGIRNDFSETSKQKNRNPFVDHPEYAWRIFGDSCSAQVKNDCIAAYPAEGGSSGGQGQSSSQDQQSSQSPQNSQEQQSSSQSSQSQTSDSDSYSVKFTNNGSDGSSTLTEENVNNYYESNTLVQSASNLNRVFAGKIGLKLGSGSGTGSITFNLKNEAKSNIEKIVIKSAKYGSDSGKLICKVNGNAVNSDITPGNDTTISFNEPTTVSSITIETSSKRAYLCEISVYLKQEQGDNPPSSSLPSDSSSDAPISSSQENSSSEEVISSSQETAVSSEENISSNTPVASSEETTSSNQTVTTSQNDNTSSNTPIASNEEENKGCNGSIITSMSLISITTLVGLVFALSKKKH